MSISLAAFVTMEVVQGIKKIFLSIIGFVGIRDRILMKLYKDVLGIKIKTYFYSISLNL